MMGSRGAGDRKLDEVLSVLSSLRGVKHAFYLAREMRVELERIEKEYPAFGPLTVSNEGLRECMKRQHVACIVKDRHFRPPPVPTVLLLDENREIIGKELLPGEKLRANQGSKTFMLGKDFVIFYEKGKGRGAKFVLPPVPFEEVGRIAGVRRVCSSSPSTAGDFYLRQCMSFDDDPTLASILVAFDLA